MLNKVILSYGADTSGALYTTANLIGLVHPPPNIRIACSRSMRDAGFTMLYVECADEAEVQLDEACEYLESVLKTRALEVGRGPEKLRRLRKVKVLPANPLHVDGRRQGRYVHWTVSVLHELTGANAMAPILDQLREFNLRIAQHDLVVRTWKTASQSRLWGHVAAISDESPFKPHTLVADHWFRVLHQCIEVEAKAQQAEIETKLRRSLGHALVVVGATDGELGLLPGNLPPARLPHEHNAATLATDKYAYIMLGCRSIPDLLRYCASTSLKNEEGKTTRIVRSVFRDFGGWACLMLCVSQPGRFDLDKLEKHRKGLWNGLMEQMKDNSIEDDEPIVFCEVIDSLEPWQPIEQPRSGQVLWFPEDEPGLIRKLALSAYGAGYRLGDHGYRVVQCDAWSQGTNRSFKVSFGLLGEDVQSLNLWMEGAKTFAESKKGKQSDRWDGIARAPWYTLGEGQYHNRRDCADGETAFVDPVFFRTGTANLELCDVCRELNKQDLHPPLEINVMANQAMRFPNKRNGPSDRRKMSVREYTPERRLGPRDRRKLP